MPIPTEPIGSVPRPRVLQEAMRDFAEGSISAEKMDRLIHVGRNILISLLFAGHLALHGGVVQG